MPSTVAACGLVALWLEKLLETKRGITPNHRTGGKPRETPMFPAAADAAPIHWEYAANTQRASCCAGARRLTMKGSRTHFAASMQVVLWSASGPRLRRRGSFFPPPRAAARTPRSCRKAHQVSPLKPKTDDRRIISQGVCSMTHFSAFRRGCRTSSHRPLPPPAGLCRRVWYPCAASACVEK